LKKTTILKITKIQNLSQFRDKFYYRHIMPVKLTIQILNSIVR
jgi:hypothetical protein